MEHAENPDPTPTPWPHAPVHKLCSTGTYMVTVSTYKKLHLLCDNNRLSVMQRGLFSVTNTHGWQLEAWAIFSNHYHFVAHSPQSAASSKSLTLMINELHSKMSKWLNKLDCSPNRRVWFNYWDTQLTNELSYFARLNYVHNNPVKHGLVTHANLYPWCSALCFEETAKPAQVKTIYSFDFNKPNVRDDFEPAS